MGLPRYPNPAMESLEWGVYVYEQYVLQRATEEIPGNTNLGERLFVVPITDDDNEQLDKQIPGGISDSSVAIIISITNEVLDVWQASQDGLDHLHELSKEIVDVRTTQVIA